MITKQYEASTPKGNKVKVFEYDKEQYKQLLKDRGAKDWCWYYKLSKGLVYPRAFAVTAPNEEIHSLNKCFAKNTLMKHEEGHIDGEDDVYFRIDVMNFTFLFRGQYD